MGVLVDVCIRGGGVYMPAYSRLAAAWPTHWGVHACTRMLVSFSSSGTAPLVNVLLH